MESKEDMEVSLERRWKEADVENGYNYWNRTGAGGGGFDTYLDVFFLEENPKLGWACGFNSKIIKTTDGGKTWKGTKIHNVNLQLETIQFLNEKVGYVSGPGAFSDDKDNAMHNAGVLFKTIDGGQTWFDITPSIREGFFYVPLWGINFYDENNGLMMGGEDCVDNGTSIFFMRTTNGGGSWFGDRIYKRDSKASDPLLLDPEGQAYALSSGMIWESKDGGNIWDRFLQTPKNDWHEELAYFNGSFLLPSSAGCSGDNTQGSGSINFYKDGIWKIKSNIPAMYGSFLLSETEGYAAGMGQSLYYTNDAGVTWIDQSSCFDYGDLDDIFFINDTLGWVVGDGVYYLGTEEVFNVVETIDTVICPNTMITFNPGVISESNQWFDQEGNLLSDESIFSSEFDKSTQLTFKSSDGYCSNTISKFTYNLEVKTNPIEFEYTPNEDLCVGDVVTINTTKDFAEYSWGGSSNASTFTLTESSTISLTVYDEDKECYFSKELEVKFNENPQPEIEVLSNLNVCVGEVITLKSKNEHSTYKWYANDNDTPFSEEREISLEEIGKYKVRLEVENEFGCISNTDIIEVEIRDETNQLSFDFSLEGRKLEYDLVYIGDTDCKSLKITNVSEDGVEIRTPYLLDNLEFSIPDYQLPIFIPAGESKELIICFKPVSEKENLDTLVFDDLCSPHKIDLFALSISNIYNAENKCEVELTISQANVLAEYYFNLSNPYPQPARNIVKLDYIYFIENDKIFNESARLYNLLGEEVAEFEKEILNEYKKPNGIFYSGSFFLNLDNISSGIYILEVKNRQNTKTYKIRVDK